MKFHTGDTVVVLTGKDRGKTGSIIRMLHSKRRVVVSGINMRTKHIKKTPQQAGQKIKYEASIDMSNVQLIDPKTKKRSRIGYSIDAKGKKVRIAKVSGEVLTHAAKAKKILKKGEEKTKEGAKKDMADGKEAKKDVKKTETAVSAPPAKKPFWKRMGFGADALDEADDSKGRSEGGSGTSQENAPPSSRSSARGS